MNSSTRPQSTHDVIVMRALIEFDTAIPPRMMAGDQTGCLELSEDAIDSGEDRCLRSTLAHFL
jgi:hypothetical protein